MDTKNKILDVSLALFAQKGFDGVSVREIAKEVGVRESALYKHYKNKEDTRDSIQELYLVLHKKAKHFHENVSARAWMVVVYKNFIKSDFRKRNREKRYIQEEMQAFKSQASTTIDKYVESRLVWKEVMDKLNDYEQSLLLYYLQAELTVREIAEVLHKPKSTIENHLQKLKEKIRKMQK